MEDTATLHSSPHAQQQSESNRNSHHGLRRRVAQGAQCTWDLTETGRRMNFMQMTKKTPNSNNNNNNIYHNNKPPRWDRWTATRRHTRNNRIFIKCTTPCSCYCKVLKNRRDAQTELGGSMNRVGRRDTALVDCTESWHLSHITFHTHTLQR